MKAPFPWFGGKSKVAHIVWHYLGDVDNYVEPFAGSLSVLLKRRTAPKAETVNDKDAYICNFWRALQNAPDEVAHYANNPVNESDLTARHIWLVNTGAERVARLDGDPDYYDAKVAGWWVWGLSCWIGSEWCSGKGPWRSDGDKLVKIGNRGKGINRQRVHLGNPGQGVNRKRVHIGDDSNGTRTGEVNIRTYLQRLAERLRYVRVCCGDWSRVVTRGALTHGSTVGIFLDPPYDVSLRDDSCYNTDDEYGNISADVRQWCIENQDNPRYRIVLAGYEGEHKLPGWDVIAWTAGRSYGRANVTANVENRRLERLWISPQCVLSERQLELL